MYAHLAPFLFAIPVLSAAFRQDFLHDCADKIVQPAWEVEDRLTIVPLIKPARQGVVPVSVEEGLIAGAGPRFANVLFSNISSDGKLGSCWQCVNTIIKETPCVYNAVSQKDPSDLLKCGVNKSDICDCAECLPESIDKYVEQWCSSSSGINIAPTEDISYVDFSYVGEYDANIQGYRGDLKRYQVDQIKRSGPGVARVFGGVTPYDTCGCPNFCVGLCIFGSCTGVCT